MYAAWASKGVRTTVQKLDDALPQFKDLVSRRCRVYKAGLVDIVVGLYCTGFAACQAGFKFH